MAEIKREIIEHIGVLSTSEKGWRKEVNVISWNDGPAKYDVRDWSPDHDKMSKGVTLTPQEFIQLKELLGGSHE